MEASKYGMLTARGRKPISMSPAGAGDGSAAVTVGAVAITSISTRPSLAVVLSFIACLLP